jgi:hypothetical protein
VTTDYRTKNVQLDLAKDKNEVHLSVNVLLVCDSFDVNMYNNC